MTPADLRLARERLGLTQAQLAEVLRMGKQGGRTVRSWELGEREVPGPVQVAVELILGLSDLMEEDDENDPPHVALHRGDMRIPGRRGRRSRI